MSSAEISSMRRYISRLEERIIHLSRRLNAMEEQLFHHENDIDDLFTEVFPGHQHIIARSRSRSRSPIQVYNFVLIHVPYIRIFIRISIILIY